MNSQIKTWIYLLVIISIAFWLIIGGKYIFPSINPIIITIVVMIIIYLMTNSQTILLLF